MKLVHTTLILVLVAGILAGCGGDASTSSVEGSSAASAESESNDAYTSAAMDASYEGALPVSSQLALGTFQLEGTENAVTPAQAAALLPLWQAVALSGPMGAVFFAFRPLPPALGFCARQKKGAG
jgi:hypothetical protein